MRRVLPLMLVALALCGSRAIGLDAAADLVLSDANPRIGQTVTARLVLEMSGAGQDIPDAAPDFPEVDGLRVRAMGGMQQQIYSTMTTTRAQVSWGYALMPLRTGTITIPPMAVRIGGVTRSTPVVTLNVRPGLQGETEIVPHVAAVLSEATTPADGTVELYLVFQHAPSPDTAPTWPPVDGAVIGAPRLRRTDTGHEVFVWPLHPTKVGTVTIPAMEVTVLGKSLSTQPLTLLVTKPRAVFTTVTVDNASPYVGQPVRVTWRAIHGNGTRLSQIAIPWIMDLKDFAVRPVEKKPGASYQELEIDKLPIPFEIRAGDGQTEIILERVLMPWRAGTYEIPSSACWVSSGFRGGNGSHSAPVTLTVRELPAEGRPPRIDTPVPVGQFRFNVVVAPDTLAAGETCELVRTVSGRGNFEMIMLDPLADSADFLVYEHTAQIKFSPNGLDGTKVFRQAIAPRAGGVSAFPQTAFSWFDPETERYHTVTAPAVPLTVTEPAGTTLLAAGLEAAPHGGLRAEKLRDDIGNIMLDGLFAPGVAVPHARMGYWLAFLLGLIGVGAAEALGQRRHAMTDGAFRRRRLARAEAETHLLRADAALAAADAHAAVLAAAAAMRQYLCDKTGRTGGEFTSTDIAELSRRHALSDDTARALADFFALADAGRFGGAATPDSARSLLAGARSLLTELEELSWGA